MKKVNRVCAIKAVGMIGSSEELFAVAEQILSFKGKVKRLLITGEDGLGKVDLARRIMLSEKILYSEYSSLKFELMSSTKPDERTGLLVKDLHAIPVQHQVRLMNALDSSENRKQVVAATAVVDDLKSGLPGLYYGFVTHVHIPSLIERPEDLDLIVPYISSFLEAFGYGNPALSRGEIKELRQFKWRQNISELRQFLIYLSIHYHSPAKRLSIHWLKNAKEDFDRYVNESHSHESGPIDQFKLIG